MDYAIVLVVLFLVVLAVTAPLRRARAGAADEVARAARVVELEAARDAKYREIRDAELDHQTGKLSDADWGAIDSTLRSEAMELLRELDRVTGAPRGEG